MPTGAFSMIVPISPAVRRRLSSVRLASLTSSRIQTVPRSVCAGSIALP